jgi:hypothetical protein
MKVYALVEWNHEGAYLCGVFDTYTEARKAFFERLKVNEYDISKGDLQDGDTLCFCDDPGNAEYELELVEREVKRAEF